MPVLLLVCVVIGIVVLFHYVGKKNPAGKRLEDSGKLTYTGTKSTAAFNPSGKQKREPKKEELIAEAVFFDDSMSNSGRICPRCDSELGMEHASCPVCGWRNVY